MSDTFGSETRAQRMGMLLMAIPLIIWTLQSLGLFNVTIPEQYFETLIWAGVALILGYDIGGVIASSRKSRNGGKGGNNGEG